MTPRASTCVAQSKLTHVNYWATGATCGIWALASDIQEFSCRIRVSSAGWVEKNSGGLVPAIFEKRPQKAGATSGLYPALAIKIKPKWSASDSCSRLKGNSTPNWAPRPNPVIQAWRVCADLFFVASSTITAPAATNSAWEILSLLCWFKTWATSWPKITAISS